MRFAKYDQPGKIVAILTCSEEMAKLQEAGGLKVIALPDGFVGDDQTHKVVNGKVVPK